jgi:twitching motility two-component system response regulator PilH
LNHEEEPAVARILIVDDAETQIQPVIQILERLGHEVLTAPDGESGVQSAKENKPDLILMDIVMPGLNGFQATRQITHDPETENIPVILVSNKDQETDKVWGTRQGAKAFLVKPVEEQLLIQALNEHLP